MDLFDCIRHRHSIRAFQKKEVGEDKINTILEAANSAPSAGDLQAYEIYLVRSRIKLQELASAALSQDFIATAPLALVFCANPGRSSIKYGDRGVKLYSVQDATIACAYAQLAATALGLGCVWVGAFDDQRVLEVSGASENLKPVAILPLGYAAESPRVTPRRGVRNLVKEVL